MPVKTIKAKFDSDAVVTMIVTVFERRPRQADGPKRPARLIRAVATSNRELNQASQRVFRVRLDIPNETATSKVVVKVAGVDRDQQIIALTSARIS